MSNVYIAEYQRKTKSAFQSHIIFARFSFSASNDQDALELAQAYVKQMKDGCYKLHSLNALEMREVPFHGIKDNVNSERDLEDRVKNANFTPIVIKP